ncbi:PAAR domain-containing protein [uncultured Cedecea sp.]|uniref:PAAR domain-containing protein n=1 Tax=uncultured Cedecea sp. TaxID=988762 RepID=UPI002638F23C|nr:PAAR domain-containing protein [uncultured Cedecea sp.]
MKGYYLVQGDKTACGGTILEGDSKNTLAGIPVSREQDSVTCGRHSGIYKIIGGIPQNNVNGRKYAGSLHSKSSCPCAAMLIPSHSERSYEA